MIGYGSHWDLESHSQALAFVFILAQRLFNTMQPFGNKKPKPIFTFDPAFCLTTTIRHYLQSVASSILAKFGESAPN